MKKSTILILTVLCLGSGLWGEGKKEQADAANWPENPVTVICPWAVGGVADMVNRKAAVFASDYLGVPVLATNELGAGGNIALTNYLKNGPDSDYLIFGGEGAFSIAPNIDGADALAFRYEDYLPVINLYSSIFVMTAGVDLAVTDLESLKAYGAAGKVTVAVNGTTGSEAFLAKALFKELGIPLELVSYNGANLALDAAAKGETDLAVSHQSQAKGSVEGGILVPVVMFDETGVDNEVFRNVKGVGEYGYSAYFRNRCLIMARKGTDPRIVSKLRNTYLTILNEPEMVDFFRTLMIEVDPLDKEKIDKHIADVTAIVRGNR